MTLFSASSCWYSGWMKNRHTLNPPRTAGDWIPPEQVGTVGFTSTPSRPRVSLLLHSRKSIYTLFIGLSAMHVHHCLNTSLVF